MISKCCNKILALQKYKIFFVTINIKEQIKDINFIELRIFMMQKINHHIP